MNTQSRIASILTANNLDFSITGLSSFNLSLLDISKDPDFQIPNNLRLGHLAEKVVSELIKNSLNYKVIYENIQIVEEKKTIGEIDFIVQELKTERLIHLELAYKFYLFDPNVSSQQINNWIGPNRNDSLVQKLEKLKKKQLPLLYKACTKSMLSQLNMEEISQAICLMVSLYVPYTYEEELNPVYKQALRGCYYSLEQFIDLKDSSKNYYLPPKTSWGIDPSENECWLPFEEVEMFVTQRMQEKQAVLVWQKCGDVFEEFFVVWW